MRLLVTIYFLLYKSCHPSVVASIIQHWLIAVNDFRVLHMQRSFKATALEDSTKTELGYLWLLPPELDEMAVEILQLRGTGFAHMCLGVHRLESKVGEATARFLHGVGGVGHGL